MKHVWLSMMLASAVTALCACSGSRDVEVGQGSDDAIDAPTPAPSKGDKTPTQPPAEPKTTDDATPRRDAEAPEPEPPAAEDAGPGSRNCSRAISCVNGACTCGAGPLAGVPCDGASTDRPTSCNVLCVVCE